MAFNVLWTILLGVLGGIISSLIVSRVFLIQSQYQDQIQFVDQIIRKLGAISAQKQSIMLRTKRRDGFQRMEF